MPRMLAHYPGRLNARPARRLAMGLALTVAAATAATAGPIQCERGFQRIKGDLLMTPYCQDAYLAEVARQYGFTASAQRIRSDPLYKKALCRYVFNDIRVQDTCLSAGVPEVYGGSH